LVGARSAHRSSISWSAVRTSRAWRSSAVRSARSSLPPSGTGKPSAITSSGPRMRNSSVSARGRHRQRAQCGSGSTRCTSSQFWMTAWPQECGRVESNHHSAGPRGYSPLSSPMLSVRMKGRPTGFEPVPRGSRPRMLPLHHSHHEKRSGDDRIRTGGFSADNRALCAAELRPRREFGRRDWLPATGDRDVAVSTGSGASCCPPALLPARVRAATSSPVSPGGLAKPAAR
jgi:hypothetical protein